MKTKQLFNVAPTYESPRIKTVKLSPRAHYLQQISPYGLGYGRQGEAGQEGDYDENYGAW